MRSTTAAGRPRRSVTARARRSSSGASSRNAYGFAFRISCANTRRLGRVARHALDRAVARSRSSTARRPVDVHRLVQAVAHRLAHQRVVGHLDAARRRGCPGSAACAGKTAASRSSARMRCSGGGTRLPPRQRSSASDARRRSSASASRTSAPAARPGSAAPRRSLGRARSSKTVSSGKLCCGPSESTMPSSVAAACSSKSNDAAEPLAQRQAPGAVDAPAERRVDDELHAARLVEEALGDDARLRRHARRAPRAPPRRSRAAAAAPRAVERARRASSQRGRVVAVARRPRATLCAQRRDLGATARACAPGASPSQNGIVGGGAVRVLDADRARSRRGGCATRCCRAGRCRPPSTRWRSPRRRVPIVGPVGLRARRRSWRCRGWRRPR